MKSGKILLTALAGVAIGAALGILFAPDKGTETRKKISKKKDDVLDNIESKFNDIIDKISSKFEKMKDGVSNSGKDWKHRAETAQENAGEKK